MHAIIKLTFSSQQINRKKINFKFYSKNTPQKDKQKQPFIWYIFSHLYRRCKKKKENSITFNNKFYPSIHIFFQLFSISPLDFSYLLSDYKIVYNKIRWRKGVSAFISKNNENENNSYEQKDLNFLELKNGDYAFGVF